MPNTQEMIRRRVPVCTVDDCGRDMISIKGEIWVCSVCDQIEEPIQD